MAVSLSTRKPVTELTSEDFAAFPVWEYAIDEETQEDRDETWVRPLNVRQIPTRGYSFQVAAELHAPCGRMFPGFCIVTTARGAVEVNGAVLLGEGAYLPTYFPDELGDHTGLSETDLFPLKFVLRVPVEGEQDVRTGPVPL